VIVLWFAVATKQKAAARIVSLRLHFC